VNFSLARAQFKNSVKSPFIVYAGRKISPEPVSPRELKNKGIIKSKLAAQCRCRIFTPGAVKILRHRSDATEDNWHSQFCLFLSARRRFSMRLPPDSQGEQDK